MKKNLAECPAVSCDGTIKAFPWSFNQLLTIHGFKNSKTLPDGKAMPITEFFQRVKSKTVENRERAQTISDVQRAMIAAVKKKFQNSSNKSCFICFTK